MRHFISIGIEALSALILLLPILLITNKIVFKNTKKTIFYIIFALYLSAVYAVVGLPSITYLRFDLNINLIPFISMIDDLKNSVLNIILFIPLGIALPLFWTKYNSIKQVALYSFGLSLLIEILQIFTFRATDINDLITNTLGGVFGYFIAKIIINRQTFIKPNNSERDLYILNSIILAVMFFIQPSISSIIWNL